MSRWHYSENIAASHLNIDPGRLKFEDERRWWWNEALDALRFVHEAETMEVALDVLTRQAGILGIFSDWPATVTYYANCMGFK